MGWCRRRRQGGPGVLAQWSQSSRLVLGCVVGRVMSVTVMRGRRSGCRSSVVYSMAMVINAAAAGCMMVRLMGMMWMVAVMSVVVSVMMSGRSVGLAGRNTDKKDDL